MLKALENFTVYTQMPVFGVFMCLDDGKHFANRILAISFSIINKIKVMKR